MEVDKLYSSAQNIKWEYTALMLNANKMLHKAKIVQNMETALVLAKTIDNMDIGTIGPSGLFGLLLNCTEHILDEAAIVSAFELFAKSKLLRSQYVIHDFDGAREKEFQKKIKNQQKKKPIHIKTYLTAKNKSVPYKLKDTTLSASLLLSNTYTKKFGLSDNCIKTLIGFNKTRNFLHSHTLVAQGLSTKTLESILELKRAIESSKKYPI